MATPPMASVQDQMEEMARAISHVQEEVLKFTPPADGDSDAVAAFDQVKKAAKALDMEAVKLSVNFFKDPVSPEICEPLVANFSSLVVVLCANWYKVHAAGLGASLVKQMAANVRGVYAGANAFCADLTAAKGKAIGDQKGAWQGAGALQGAVAKLWDMPTQNSVVVSGLLKRTAR
eukprot:CAMPEP_0182919500 /NCGR_PEP_ID=MMETSP0105_2-20130417/2772_1 /TAXON_ID=81532 ORGANISM="Acanthoeca-like sp., Strain 10tr" /NCGR_SAMPLE_ID=MMETSP0105_2 /ASSEMBLY_ACC=CAM_ASM_000205 /LENGTH=175 /DNA_ID=CAMNT_0025056699 /DNA_START=16 /DNA_END=543 /DNA_ORIENTATION=-